MPHMLSRSLLKLSAACCLMVPVAPTLCREAEMPPNSMARRLPRPPQARVSALMSLAPDDPFLMPSPLYPRRLASCGCCARMPCFISFLIAFLSLFRRESSRLSTGPLERWTCAILHRVYSPPRAPGLKARTLADQARTPHAAGQVRQTSCRVRSLPRDCAQKSAAVFCTCEYLEYGPRARAVLQVYMIYADGIVRCVRAGQNSRDTQTCPMTLQLSPSAQHAGARERGRSGPGILRSRGSF
eukprot:COSAG06_NODE_17979_length_910_cov_1.244143_1_plen_242_part_00